MSWRVAVNIFYDRVYWWRIQGPMDWAIRLLLFIVSTHTQHFTIFIVFFILKR